MVEREESTASMESTGEEKWQCLGRFQKDGILEVLTWPGFLPAPGDTSGSSPRPRGEVMVDAVWPRPFLGFHHLPCSLLLSAEAFLLSPTAPPGPLGNLTGGLNVQRVGPTPLAPACPSLISLAYHGHTATIRKLCWPRGNGVAPPPWYPLLGGLSSHLGQRHLGAGLSACLRALCRQSPGHPFQ